MKYLFVILLLLMSCKTPRQQVNDDKIKFNVTEGFNGSVFYVIVIDKCEYVVFSNTGKGGIIHKANCKNHQ